VLMHARGRSSDMYREAVYASVTREIVDEMRAAIERAVAVGVPRTSIVIDPGLGFAKRPEHSFEALAGLPELAALDRPVLVGVSRKSFLSAAVGERAPAERDFATAASVAAAVLLGAHIVRVHAVGGMIDAVRVADRIRAAASTP
jgi:dihydropteroate synthase